MAKIEMDISEYEALKENKKLLEVSLEREKELSKQIAALNKERITALEDAKMKVVRVTRTMTTEHLLKKRVDGYAVRQLYHLLGVGMSEVRVNPELIDMDKLGDVFFTKIIGSSVPVEEVTTCGLDEIVSELRKEAIETATQSVKEKLRRADAINEKFDQVIADKNSLVKDIQLVRDINKALTDNCDKLQVKVDILTKVQATLKGGYNFLNKKVILDKIISLLKDVSNEQRN